MHEEFVDGQGRRYVKVVFDVPADGMVAAEGIWCLPLGGGLYRVENAPWFAYDVSAEDVVRAASGPDGRLRFVAVEERGGHATLRVVFEEDVPAERRREVLDNMPGRTGEEGSEEKVTFERAAGTFYAVDLPSSVAREGYGDVLEYLDRHVREGTLSYEEGDPPEEISKPPEGGPETG